MGILAHKEEGPLPDKENRALDAMINVPREWKPPAEWPPRIMLPSRIPSHRLRSD